MELDGRSVLVTGATRGIGAATAAAFAARGARVLATDRSASAGIRALDVTDRGAFEAFVAAHGPIDVLVNNAGIMPLRPLLDEDERALSAMLEVNLVGVVNGVRACLPGMLERGEGAIVNLASLAALVPAPGGAFYAGTKAAVLQLTRSLRMEHAGSGVRFSVVLPAVVATELTAGLAPGWPRPRRPEEVALAVVRAVERGRLELVVPRWLGWLATLGQLLPVAWRDPVARAFGLDTLLIAADPEARAAYRSRLGL